MAIFCQSGPTPAVSAASVATSRGVGALSRSVMPWPAAMSASSAVSMGVPRGMTPGCHQAPQERVAEAALVVVARPTLTGDGLSPDEQQPIAQWREVGEGLDERTVDEGRDADGARVPGRREVSQVVGKHPSDRAARSRAAGWSRSGRPVAGGVALRRGDDGAGLDLRLGLGRLGRRFADAARECLAELRERLRSAPDEDSTRTTTRTMRRESIGGWYARRQRGRAPLPRLGRSATGTTRRTAVYGWPRTTPPCCRPDRRPWRPRGGRRSGGWRPCPCVRRPRSCRSDGGGRPALERREIGGRLGAEQDDIGLGFGRAVGHVGGARGDEWPDVAVVDGEEGDAHARPEPELVEQGVV